MDRFSAGPNPTLDYGTPTPRQRRLKVWRLIVGVVCLLISVASFLVARENSKWLPLVPMPDPPRPTDPYWQQQSEGESWFLGSCCSGLILGAVGLSLTVGSFRDVLRLANSAD